ncbi:MAG TPA: lipid-A-disaccharide synthase [Flavobacteriales bacterium]|nr:lipid-A-disaccharide synthase [Flavobacteriales bacterium]HIK63015.1 lipid-A-disaccharide synthase [Flavobacteriales bacterium]
MKLYIVTGEPSGDLHAANLAHELKIYNSILKIRAWGGDRLIAEGVELAKNIKDTAFMGFWDVLKNLRAIKSNLDFCKKDILNFKPDAIILVDYPGFNLKIAQFAQQQEIKVFYYISPKVWAWNKSRVSKIKKYVDELLVVFPFEVDFYQKNGMKATYVGNPLLDEIAKGNFEFTYHIEKPIIALLPGSRKQEIERILPQMLMVVNDFPTHQFVIAATNSFSKAYYQSFIKEKNVSLVFDETYGLLYNATAALVTSGTATLETALFNVPQVVCYKTNWLTYVLAKNLIKIKYLSLVNILIDKLVVKELIQSDLNQNTLKQELELVLYKNENILLAYKKLKELLNKKGASKNAAKFITDSI